jgi:hypothetical protein
MLKSDSMDVRTAIIKTASSAKQRVSGDQYPIDGKPPGEIIPPPAVQVPAVQVVPESSVASSSPAGINSTTPIAMDCKYDMAHLKQLQQTYELQNKIEYTKRYVRGSRQNIPRKSITKVEQKFMSNKVQVLDLNKQYHNDQCPELLEVPVPQSPFPSHANASDYIFGVSTTYKRFADPKTSSLNEWTYWLTDSRGNSNGGKLVLMLLDASDEELESAYDQLTAKGIDVDVYQSDPNLEMAVRYLTLVPTLYTHPERQNRKWLVVCDDDTFFPSFNSLHERFEQYDHTQPMYIGTFSEDVNNIQRHGSQAFGGGGVFLTQAMGKVVTDKYQSCRSEQKVKEADSGWGPQGDILLRKCIYENSETKLTLVNELWQLDLYGDPSGFYESGLKPLSLHHYRGGGWHLAFPWHYTKVSHVCGEDCMMQRFQFADDFILANGFSVAHYPKGINFDLNQVERTFTSAPDDYGWNLDFKFGPQRQSLLNTGRKISWDLKEATVNDDGSVTQIYIRKHDDNRWKTDGREMSGIDGVIELVWIP